MKTLVVLPQKARWVNEMQRNLSIIFWGDYGTTYASA